MKTKLFLLFAIMTICTNAFAANTLTLESKNAKSGSTIQLALTLSQASQISAISTDISYDSNIFESANAEIGPVGLNAGKTIVSKDMGDKIRVVILSIANNDIISDGVVAYLILTIKQNSTGTAYLKNIASGADPNGEEVVITGNTAQISFTDEPVIELPENVTSYKVLTDNSLPLNILKGQYVQVFGSAGVNTINVESGGRVELRNFVGSNVVNIEDNSSDFTVYRSGATVYLKNSITGTLIKIPATFTVQKLCFADDCYNLVISGGKVMIDTKEITKIDFPLSSISG
ncbi:MAG: hypothetical protein HQK70_06185 [Desulfamplus sp.]|nr:hypothetical protein [Desulfamplus sp.]